MEPLRKVADEIVIAADSRVDAESLAEYAAVADQLFRIEVVHSERHFAWMHQQCTGDWIFRIDADELASPALVAALPQLIQNRDIRQACVPAVLGASALHRNQSAAGPLQRAPPVSPGLAREQPRAAGEEGRVL
jgi:hypothetical protein